MTTQRDGVYVYAMGNPSADYDAPDIEQAQQPDGLWRIRVAPGGATLDTVSEKLQYVDEVAL
jgi:hypothetical protein